MKKTLVILILCLFSQSCEKEEIFEYKEVDAVIFTGSVLPNLPAPEKKVINEKDIAKTEGDITFLCKEKTYSYSENMDKVVAFNPNAGTLFPGALVQGKDVRKGILNSIGSFPRAPINIIAGNLLKKVENPNNASVNQAILDMVSSGKLKTTASVYFNKVEAHTTQQALLELGIDYDWGKGYIGGEFNIAQTVTSSSVFIYFVQEYYTVSIDQPATPGQFFAAGTDVGLLGQKISEGNPLCYVSSVTYGRMLIAKITSSASRQDIIREINAGIKNVEGSLSFTNSEILKNSKYEIFILGGNTEDAVAATTGGMKGIVDYLNNGASFSMSSLGAPISYIVRHAADNSIVKMGNALEYTANENCFADPETTETFKVKIDGFEIINDCDNGFIGNDGPGEFTYSIEIMDNDKLEKNISSSAVANLKDGERLVLDAGPYGWRIGKQSENSLIIKGCLVEHDDTPTQMCWAEINIPYKNIGYTPTRYTQEIDKGSNCKARLLFTIWKE